MPPVEIASSTRAATLLPRLAAAVRPSSALLGIVAAVASTAGVASAGASPWPALAAVPALFIARTLGDYRGATRIIPVGLIVLTMGVAGVLLLPVMRMIAEIITGVGAGILLPAAIALITAPDARANGATPTPRITLPHRFEVPVSGRGAHRRAILLAIVAGGLLAVAAVLASVEIPRVDLVLTGLVPAAALVIILLIAALRLEFSVAAPIARAEAAGAVLLQFASVFGIAVAAAGVVESLLPGGAVVAASVVPVTGIALALGASRHPNPERFSAAGRTYKSASAAFDATAPLRPERALTARSSAEVRSAVREARAAGLGVRAHSTGHAAGVVNPVEGSALIKVAIDEPVTVDAERRTVRIPAGTAWRDVVLAITPFGLGAPHGSSSHVGAIGYLLRGGLSAYGRTTGLGANSIESIEVVLADGDHVVADADHHAELFWALRGGGGGLGVVTAVTVRLFDLACVVTGTTIWTLDKVEELAGYWDSWRHAAPRSITTTLRLMDFPAFPGLPRAIVGKPILVIDGSVVAPREEDVAAAESVALELLGGLRAIATPLVDSWKVATAFEAANTHMDPPIGPPHTSDHFLLETSGPEAVDAFLRAGRSDDTKVSSIELRQLGGALADPVAGGGAVSHYRGDLAYWGLGVHSRQLTHDAIVRRLDGVREILSPWDSGYSVPTFAPDPSRPQRTLDSTAARRVAAARLAYDPDGVFAGDVAAGAVERSQRT